MSGTAPPTIPRSSRNWLTFATNLSFSAQLDITFFEGQGKAPTDLEIEALIHETELFFSDLFLSVPPTNSVFESFSITNVVPTYNEEEDADHFQVIFDATLVVAAGSSITMDTVANVVDQANYDEYISDYVWMSEPFRRNEFYQTHSVSFKCHPLEMQTQRRSLRGISLSKGLQLYSGGGPAIVHHVSWNIEKERTHRSSNRKSGG